MNLEKALHLARRAAETSAVDSGSDKECIARSPDERKGPSQLRYIQTKERQVNTTVAIRLSTVFIGVMRVLHMSSSSVVGRAA